MNRIIIIIAILLLIAINAYAQEKNDQLLENIISPPAEFIAQPFDVLHYSAYLDMSQAPTTYMQGVCDITVHWIGDPDTSKFFFHLRALDIDSMFYNGVRVDHQTIGTRADAIYYHEISPQEGNPGDTAIITVYYQGEMTPEDISSSRKWGGVHRYADFLYALGVGIQNTYVSTTQHWLPCYDHPSDKATLEAKFLVPKDMTVASVGTVDIIEGEDYNTHIWTHDHPCATYLYTFAIGYLHKLDFYGADVPVDVYAWESDTVAARFHFERVPRMVNYFESLFGDYPFEKVGYVITPKGSMEHQTMISMARSLVIHEYAAEDTLTITTAHELSHMWFGDMVTCRDFGDAWLNEGFATFCEALWLEHLVGRDAYLSQLEGDIGAYIDMISVSEGIFPLHDFKRTPPSSNYPGTIYDKGAAVLGMLRYLFDTQSDKEFFEALRYYLNKHKYGVATTEDLLTSLKEFSGIEFLDTFFDQWVYGQGWPTFTIECHKILPEEGDLYKAKVHIEQTQTENHGYYQKVPISMIFEDDEGNEKEFVIEHSHGDPDIIFEDLFDFTNIRFNQGNFRSLIGISNFNITGVVDIPELDFTVYPNPASEIVNVSLADVYGSLNLSIVDILGKVVFSKTLVNPIGKINEQINLESIETGLYYIVLDRQGFKKTEPLRIIK
jgi:aminopeptidase N